VGLDEGSRHIRSYLQGGRAGACTLRAYLGGPMVSPMELPSPDTLPDDFGTETACPGVKIGHVPRTPAGELDRDALRQVGKPEASIAPRTELERVVASIWREVLELATIGVDDNFFDLGGDSLRIAQLGRRLSETLNRDVALTDLYEHPTVATLAARLGAGAEPRPAETDEADRRGAARRSRATRRARPASGRDREEQAHDVQ
jgi:aryl carrier-like protein